MASIIQKILIGLNQLSEEKGWQVVQVGNRVRIHGANRGFLKTDILADISVSTDGATTITEYANINKPFSIMINQAVTKALMA